MRIYEFAQQHHILSKDIIEQLQQHGFDAKSHMSVLDEKAIMFLESNLKKSKQAASPQEVKTEQSEKKELKTPAAASVVAEKRDEPVLQENLQKHVGLELHPMSVENFAGKIKK